MLTAWIAYQKLKPQKRQIEVEAEYKEVEAAAVVADKAMALLGQMEESLSQERARLVERNVDLMAQLAASQGEVEDLLQDKVDLRKEIDRLTDQNFRLHSRYDKVIEYLKQYAETIEQLKKIVKDAGLPLKGVDFPEEWNSN